MSRVATSLRMGARQYRRTPVLLALLVFLPAYVIGLFSLAAPDASVAFAVNGEPVQTSLSGAFPAFLTPMTAALFAGIAGLFVMTSAESDRRLAVAGYRAHEVILARLGLVVGLSGLATVISVAIMWIAFTPSAPVVYVGAVWLTALVYGMVGVLVGTALDRLPGVYLVLFGTLVDLFLFQNPLATDPPAVATVLPGHFPVKLATAAGFAGTVDIGTLLGALAALGVVTLLATIGYAWAMGS